MTPSPSSPRGGSALLSSPSVSLRLASLMIGSGLLLGACDGGAPAAERTGSGSESADPDQAAFLARKEENARQRAITGEGRWRVPQGAPADETAVDAEVLEQLLAIGYAAGSQAPSSRSGVVVHDPDRSAGGLNFVVSGDGPHALITDMEGRVLHRWSRSIDELWPDHPADLGQQSAHYWRRAYVYPDGTLLAMFSGLGLVKLDRDSEVIWARPIPVHHDLEVLPNGDICVLTREVQSLPAVAARIPALGQGPDASTNILVDFVTVLAPDGTRKQHVSLIDCFEAGGPEADWARASREFWERADEREFTGQPADVFHTNSIARLRGRAEHRDPAFAEGNLLISARHLDAVAVVDTREWKVLWSMTGATTLQHDPSITRTGQLLLFDNLWQNDRSRVVVFDLPSRSVLWEYGAEEGQQLYSETCGLAQELPNGNVLITESDNGRALEVTREGDIVWEFFNPERAGEHGEFVASLLDVVRLPAAFGADWLESGG